MFLPLLFYVKSTLADFNESNTAVVTPLKALNLDFQKILNLKMSKVLKNSEVRVAQMVKMADFGTVKSPELISRTI